MTVEHSKAIRDNSNHLYSQKQKGKKDMKVTIIDDEPLISDKLKGSWKRDYGVCIRFVLLQMQMALDYIEQEKPGVIFDRYSYAGHHWNRSGKADQSEKWIMEQIVF